MTSTSANISILPFGIRSGLPVLSTDPPLPLHAGRWAESRFQPTLHFASTLPVPRSPGSGHRVPSLLRAASGAPSGDRLAESLGTALSASSDSRDSRDGLLPRTVVSKAPRRVCRALG